MNYYEKSKNNMLLNEINIINQFKSNSIQLTLTWRKDLIGVYNSHQMVFSEKNQGEVKDFYCELAVKESGILNMSSKIYYWRKQAYPEFYYYNCITKKSVK